MNRLKPASSLLWLVLLAITPATRGDDTPIVKIEDVRVGMTGYGMSVFHGTAIEPFPVEVVSIIRDGSPHRGTIWVRCTDERMRLNGPVQGMSGSPIYLWDEGERGTPGEGGRLIGAFAFGYRMSKDCIVGVQPIELMREVATRKDEPAREARGGSWERSRAGLAQLARIGALRDAPQTWTWRATMLGEVAGAGAPAGSHGRLSDHAEGGIDAGAPRPMLLPLSVGSASVAEALRPLFEPMGLSPVAGGVLSGPPPAGIDADAVQLAPGSVLAVPLVFGDMDLAASGTVTEVLDDGTVLGFGHAMFAEGGTALPMATGYVHFVLPSVDISFKRSGSLKMIGTLVRDEEVGVLGTPGVKFTTAPIHVDVEHVDGAAESFDFEMVNYRPLVPQIAATVVLSSLTARHSVPVECTIDLDATLAFAGGRTFQVSSTLAGADVTAPLFELLPALMLMTENPFESVPLESLRVAVKVRPGVAAATIVNASLDHAEVAPGGAVRVTLELQPHNAPRFTVAGSITIPRDTPEGDYPLTIGGGATYANMLNRTRPHRTLVTGLDDLTDLLRDVYAVPNTGIYLMLQRDGGGVAVGRTEMPRVPSSRAALLTSPTHSRTLPFGRLTVSRIDTDLTLASQAGFQISVRKGAYGALAESSD